MTTKLEIKIKDMWDNYREEFTPAEKGQLTRFKNNIEHESKESLAMSVTMYCHGNTDCMNVFKKGYVNHFISEFPENGSKFVAHFADGSGCRMFEVESDGSIFGVGIGEIPEMEWFIDAMYGTWQYLPDDF
jgi:hypothetical protein